MPNQVEDRGFGAGKVLVFPIGQATLLFLSDRKKERRPPASLSPSVRMCTASLHNYSIIIHCRFPSATKTMERRSKSSPFPWAQWFNSHKQLLLFPLWTVLDTVVTKLTSISFRMGPLGLISIPHCPVSETVVYATLWKVKMVGHTTNLLWEKHKPADNYGFVVICSTKLLFRAIFVHFLDNATLVKQYLVE